MSPCSELVRAEGWEPLSGYYQCLKGRWGGEDCDREERVDRKTAKCIRVLIVEWTS